ncbi:MAG: SafA/ExsA family spore coat assembly protein [Eubacteriales bacterium]
MKKLISIVICTALCFAFTVFPVNAATSYTVIRGDTLWKIAAKYKVGVSELINANPQLRNPDAIYPGNVLTIPTLNSGIQAFEAEVIRLCNSARSQNGLGQFASNWELSRVARYKSQDMHDKRYFSHTSPTYGSPFAMMNTFGISYRTAGENIAMGQRTAQAVFNAWMNSPGHRANILNGAFKQIGVGYVADGNYWTQMFIG